MNDMETPICDFVRKYSESETVRAHMPGHKGADFLGFEKYDITEISGADSLYEADGIIRRSEENAGRFFGCNTFYSAEGSSLCIRAMLYLAIKGKKNPLIAAGRNAHKAFLNAAAMLDFDILWLTPDESESYLSCGITAESLENAIKKSDRMPDAVYLTSPDYLGSTVDIAAISAVCKKHGILLLVDNAHGAYLKFLPESRHPTDLGADICCDSAHKTLPVITGGAYLHIADKKIAKDAKNALAMFGSTSPSYLILQSLDNANKYFENYPKRLEEFVYKIYNLKVKLKAYGYTLCGDEPLKITVKTKLFGYRGTDFAQLLRSKGIECEFADPDFAVLMLTPETGEYGIKKIEETMLSIPKKEEIGEYPPEFVLPERVMSVRDAAFSEWETIPARECEGRILAAATVGCPPAVPIVCSGEKIDKNAVKCFEYYGIEACTVIKEEKVQE